MAETTQLRGEVQAGSKPREDAAVRTNKPGGVRQKLANVLFWAYERGSRPYDLIVILILAFIFVTPRAWFDDRPTLQLTDLRNHLGIVEVTRNSAGGSYLVDARLVDGRAPQKLEDAVSEILQPRVQRPFIIKSVEPIREGNVLLGYTVVVDFK
ncbi:MAG: hypothetical protein HY508_06840 [Acidobacteria bacterium]|nr:hypothetical protein [Acidobacteriota bacterium]